MIKGEWKKVEKISKKLNKLKNSKLEKLTKPVSAFVTFETEEGYLRALKSTENITLLGERAVMTQASEPTNIIWENREVGFISRFFRGIGILLILALICTFCFSIIVTLMRYNDYAFEKYQNQDCQELNQIYKPQMLKDYAIEEWFEYY